ncbi:hypothetical protein AAFP30_18440 [Gordonia sp. CPCC 205515]|uniref:hypothetical protein n=1 Tax=Gordonia sp. CPCC 205515 TaxID=3140791 RepID=UPI003AF3739F
MSTTRGYPRWVDHTSLSGTRARAFYGALFGWTFTADDDSIALAGGLPVCGIAEIDSDLVGFPSFWHPYFAIDSLADLALHPPSDGEVVWGPGEYGDGLAQVVSIRDPSGASFSLWEPGTLPGFAAGGDNTPIWFELVTPHTAAVAAFYCELFDCIPSGLGTEESPYRVFTRPDAGPFAGAVAADVDPYWRVYFRADDLESAVLQAESLGGRRESDITDLPLGRSILLRDPLGALFGLLQPIDAPRDASTSAPERSAASPGIDNDNAGYPTTLSL